MAGSGGAWKVAYADFVTAMMAFFMVMWIVAQNKDAKEAVSAYFRDPFGDSSRPSGTGHLEGSELKLRPPPETKLKGGAKVPILKMLHDRDGTPIGTYVLFPDEKAELDEIARRRLTDLTPMLLGKQNKIEIRGHTARRSRLIDPASYDLWKLSYDRCQATMKFLVDHGVDASRLRLSQAGPHEPYVGSENPAWKTRNSRVEIIMLNEYVDDFTVTRRKLGPDDEDEAHDEQESAHAPAAKPTGSAGSHSAAVKGGGH
jgi:flagellar motor protein MotB